MEVSEAEPLVQHSPRENSICSSSSSLSCAVLGDICMSEVLDQPGDIALPKITCNEESRYTGSFQSAFDGCRDKQVNCKVNSITDHSKFEEPAKKKKKKKKRSYSSKKISDNIVSTTGESKYDGSDAKPSSLSIKEDILSPVMNCEKGLENNTPLMNSTSLCEMQVYSEDSKLHNCNTRTCCKGLDKNNQRCEVCNSSNAFSETDGFKFNYLASELDAVNKTRNHPHDMTGKENRQSFWQKRQRSVKETQISEDKRLQCKYVQKDACLQQRNLFVKHNSFVGNGLLPSPLIESSRHISAANGTTNRETTTFELNYYMNRYKAQRTYGSQHVFTHGASCLHSSADFSAHGQPTRACSTKFTVPVQCGFQSFCGGVKIPGMNHVPARSFQGSTNRKIVTSGMNAKKWVPFGNKGSNISGKIGSAGICHVCNGDLPFLLEGENNDHSRRNIIDYHTSDMLSKSEGTNLSGGHRMNGVKTEAPNSDSQSARPEVHHVKSAEVIMECAQNFKDVQQLIIGLQMVTDPLNAAYKIQLVSEGFEIVTGSPLAEFERFLHSSIPVIASSYLHAKCSVCLGDQLSNSFLCKHQIPNTSLFDVWKWYEEPGNYGLKVKVGDSQYLKGLHTEPISFHAHFVPYLSAVRLFGYSHLSNSYGTSEECSNPDTHTKNSSTALEEQHLLAPWLKFGSIDEDVNSHNIFSSGGRSPSFIPSPARSSNCELVFEYFETEKPWLRKPLHKKIEDLMDAEASNLRGFGDPSKLKILKLNDLHPASWFSVAWYPIYQIPEGKFGAAFLTYHSLGHLVLRDVPADSLKTKTLSVVSPVVGLLSYKAQAECWFDLKIPADSSSLFNWSEILQQQLKILEENASLFARGCVWTDGNTVINRHQDYGFFSSQKQY